ncbi:MAG: GNAT family N-acetyltransferase [Pseudomonadota bacterium]
MERSILTSWPALSVAYDEDWVIRLADGVTKRSNSVTCLGADNRDLERRIDRVVKIYEAHGLPTIFRLSPLAGPALSTCLDQRGWRRFDETIIMTADLDHVLAQTEHAPDLQVDIDDRPDRDWIRHCFRLEGAEVDTVDTLETMLQRLVPKAGYARAGESGQIDALGLMVIDDELAGLFEVLTVKERRRQGLAGALLHQLFRWSRNEGARTGWLAVVADNLPAVGLYRKLGFREVYRYHYRSNA